MFNNPLRKYASGGPAPSQDQQKMLEAFVAWLPKRVKEFADMAPEQIVEALNGMSQSPEGQKQVEQLMQQFRQEMSGTSQFAKGGKLNDFICKHAKGGHIADCGCDKKVAKGEDGLPDIGNHSPRPASINVPTIPGLIAEFRQHKVADSGNATNRNFSKVNWRGNQYFLERANINGNTADTWIQVTPQLDTLVEQTLPSGRVAPLTIEQAQSIVDRNRADINSKEKGGVVKGQGGIPEGMPETSQIGIVYGKRYNPIGENQSAYQGDEYVTTKKEPLLGKQYVGWRREVEPGTTKLAYSDMFGGTPEGMTHRFTRVNNGTNILDVIRPYYSDVDANELNTVQRLINGQDTTYFPDKAKFIELLRSKGTFANGRPNWIVLDTERNKVNNK